MLAVSLSDDGSTIDFPIATSLSGRLNILFDNALFLKTAGTVSWSDSSIFDGEIDGFDGMVISSLFNLSELTLVYPDEIFNLKAGRLFFSEKTGKIFNQTADGIVIDFSVADLTFSLFGCYTGLLWKNDSTVFLSALDEYYAAQDTTVFSSPRIVASLSTDIVLNPDNFLFFSCTVQKDLRELFDDSQLIVAGDSRETDGIGGLVDTLHAAATFSSRISDYFSWNLFGIFETGNILMCPVSGENKDFYVAGNILSYCAGISLSILMPDILGSMLVLEGVYSSGDNDKGSVLEGNTEGYDNAYVPISSVPIATVLPFQLGNTWYADISWLTFPFMDSGNFTLERMLVKYQLRALFRSSVGPISVYGLESSSLSAFLGIECGAAASVNILSDLALTASFNGFFPGLYPVGAFESDYVEGRIVLFSASVSTVLSF